MRKLFLIISFFICAIASYSQDVSGTRIIARQSLFIRDRWVDTILVDTSLFALHNRSIPTAGAVYDFVAGRMGSGGGGGGGTWGSITGTLSNQTDLQTALNLKANLASPTFSGTVTIPTPFTLGAVSVLPTGTELNFVDGVTSNIQTQLDGKQTQLNGTGFVKATGTTISYDNSTYLTSVPLSSLVAATGVNTINNLGTQTWNWNSITNSPGLRIQSSSHTTSAMVSITSNSAGAASNSLRGLEVITNGANTNASQTTIAGYFGNGNSGTSSTNIGLRAAAGSGSVNIALDLGNGSGSSSDMRMNGSTSGAITIKTAAAAGTWSLTLPATDGASGEFLQTDGNGVTTWAAPAAVGNTIYTGDGTLAGDRTVDLDGNNLFIQQGGNDFLKIQPNSFHSELEALDGTAETGLQLDGNSAGTVKFNVFADNGTNTVEIEGNAQDNTLEYTADTHTFNGTVIIPTPFTLGAVSVLPTGTELNFVDGVTSSIQTQLDAKQATITFGTGVQTALGVNIGSAGAPVLFNGALGTPSSGTGTNITGIPAANILAGSFGAGAYVISTSLQAATIELSHATQNTLSASSGVLSIESVVIPTISSTNTLTNKRITARYGSTTSSATPTINTDNVDMYELTAQAADITSFTTNLTGTPAIDDALHIAITGTAARAITWGASFENSSIALPLTTVTTNRIDIVLLWTGSKWRCAGVW